MAEVTSDVSEILNILDEMNLGWLSREIEDALQQGVLGEDEDRIRDFDDVEQLKTTGQIIVDKLVTPISFLRSAVEAAPGDVLIEGIPSEAFQIERLNQLADVMGNAVDIIKNIVLNINQELDKEAAADLDSAINDLIAKLSGDGISPVLGR